MWALCLLYTVWCVAFRFKAVPCSWLPFENKTHQMFGKYRWKSKCLMLFTYAGINMVLFLVVPSALLFSALFFLHSCNFVASSVSSTSFVLVSSVFPSLCGYMTAIPVFVHSFFSPRVFFSISSQVVIRLTIYVTRQISINHKHNHQPQRRKKNDRNLTLSHHHPHTFSLCRASLYHLPLLSFPPPHPNERSISVLFIAILNNS